MIDVGSRVQLLNQSKGTVLAKWRGEWVVGFDVSGSVVAFPEHLLRLVEPATPKCRPPMRRFVSHGKDVLPRPSPR